MDNSVYIALSRQVSSFRHMDMVANNIANSNTAGFRAERMLFNDYLVEDGNRNDMAFTQDIATYHDTRPGPMRTTGNPLDLAISGDGYFTVEMPDGRTGFTRNGRFQIDGQGFIVTQTGMPVLDEGGQRIQLQPEDQNIVVGEDGFYTVNGQQRGVFGVAEFNNEQELKQLGNGLFDAQGAAALPPQNSRVLQGVAEDSNVSPVTEIVNMTRLSRSVSSTAEFIEVMYDLQRRANNVYTQQS
jgi:flagellar basal-body rod protein FlgF